MTALKINFIGEEERQFFGFVEIRELRKCDCEITATEEVGMEALSVQVIPLYSFPYL